MDNVISFWRTDRWGNPLGRLGYVYEAQRNRTTSGTDTLDISCHTQCDKGDRIIFTDAMGKVREYIITDVELVREESLQFTYHCSGSMSELGLYVIEDRRVRGGTSGAALARALEGTRWAVGTVSGSGTNDISFYHTTALTALKDIMDTWGLELEAEYTLSADGDHIIGRKINATPHLGSSVARPFSFGRNLAGLSRTINADDVITRVYPYGKGIQETDESGEATGGYSRKIDITSVNGGVPYVEDTTATSIWGIPDASGKKQAAMSVLDFGDIEDPQELKAAAQAELNKLKSPHVSYTATVSVLGLEGKDRYALGLGDDVHIIDTAYPSVINIQGRVLEIKDDLLNPLSDDTQITLGNLVDVFTTESERVSSVVDKLLSNSGAWNGAAGAAPPFIDSVINGINVNLNKTGGYTYLTENEGIIVYDKPKDENPTMAIQLGGGYFRIANSKKSNGEWNWRTMGTGAGLVADVLVAGTIIGGSNTWNLETGDLSFTQGTIGRSDGSTYWNLTTGDFRFAPTSSIGDTGNTIGGTVINANVQYGLSDSDSTVPSSWTDTAEWSKGKVLWSRTVSKSADGTVTYGTPQVIIGANGNGVSSVREQYYLSQSNTTQTGGSWSYAQPAWVKGCYYWTRSEITWSDGSKQYTTPVFASALTSGNQSTDDLDDSLNQEEVFNRLTNNGALQGIYMSGGKLYINATYLKTGIIIGGSNTWNLETGDLSFTQGTIGRSDGSTYWNLTTGDFRFAPTSSIGDTGNTIGGTVINANVQYGLSDSDSTVPSSWTDTAEWSKGKVLWSRTVSKSADGTVTYGTPQVIIGANGNGVSSVREQYYLSQSNTTQTGGSWSYAQPAWVKGCYYWTRSEITWSDGSKQYTTPVFASALTSGNQSTDDLDDSLNQEEVFNRLTNNGALQGIYMSGGKLYINATYLKTGIITGGSSHWNLNTGEFTTYNMQANNITAKGTFSCGPTNNRTELNSIGQIAGYHNNAKIGYIDYSAESHDVDNPSIINRGLQLQAQGIVRISSPRISVAASRNVGTTASYGWTGLARQKIVSSITDNGNGTIGWHYGTMSIRVVNGIVTNITTFG